VNKKGTPENLKPFQKGDPRINRKGRPKSFDALRELGKAILHEPAKVKDAAGNIIPVVKDGEAVSMIQVVLNDWATSKDFRKQEALIAIAFGRVPKEENEPTKPAPTGSNLDNLTDEEIEALIERLTQKRQSKTSGSVNGIREPGKEETDSTH